MFKTSEDVIRYAEENGIRMLDLKFSDLSGRWHHLTLPRARFTAGLFTKGEAFDGSATPGFASVEAGDMRLVPDPATAVLDPFWEIPTLSMVCNVYEIDAGEPFHRDPRAIGARAERCLADSGIADESLWSPEFEFYIFDSINCKNDVNMASYVIDSEEADWNTGMERPGNLGHKIPRKGGYHAIPPLDSLYEVRGQMVEIAQSSGIEVRYHHHEVGGPGQSEIEILPLPLLAAGDTVMWVKYVTKMVAKKRGKTVTFMPKPLYNEAGSGMHFHQQLLKGGRPLFYSRSGYAGLSRTGLHYIGGLLAHSAALLSLTNPSTNSYKRLVPGFEAPTRVFFSLGNRSAAVRIPRYADSPETKRIEFRPPDGTSNPYLAMAAMLLAGLDGIKRKLDPSELGFGPFDVNVFKMPPEERSRIGSLPTSLKEALDALEKDHAFLLQGGVFRPDFMEWWREYKMEHEYNEVRNRPHPYEMILYFDV